MTRLSYLFVIICIVSLGGSAAAETYVVNPEGTGDFETIADALWSVEAGDVIELTDGTFTGLGNRDISFETDAVTVRSQSGNPEACIIDCEGSEGDPHRGFRIQGGVGPGAVVEGITITNGWRGTDCGSAIIVRENSSPTIRNCRIIDCDGECVPGIFVAYGSPTIVDCYFEGNSCGINCDGGAIFVTGGSSTIIDGCHFNGNFAPLAGAVIVRFDGTPTISNCLFEDNSSDLGGAVVCDDDSIVLMDGCTIVGNEAQIGAGILCRDQASLTISNSIIASNTGSVGIECQGTATVDLSCSDVWGNSGGDWVGCLAGLDESDGNISADPCFCIDSYYIAETSPCASANNTCGVTIGALGTECVDCGGDVPTVETTWGQLKAGYR